MFAKLGCSKISIPMPDKIAQKKNWMQDIFTPSTIGEKWSITVIWMENSSAHDRLSLIHI